MLTSAWVVLWGCRWLRQSQAEVFSPAPQSPACLRLPSYSHPAAPRQQPPAAGGDGRQLSANLHTAAEALWDWSQLGQWPAGAAPPASPAWPWRQQQERERQPAPASIAVGDPPAHCCPEQRVDCCGQVGAGPADRRVPREQQLRRSSLVRLAEGGPGQQHSVAAGATLCHPPLKLLRPGALRSAAGTMRPYSAGRCEDCGEGWGPRWC